MNEFPKDFKSKLTGFGGDVSMNRAQHKAAIKRTPVILVHGNASNSADPTFGMLQMKKFLIDSGYLPSEIWAMDYLGENRRTPPDLTDTLHRDHIDAFRNFIDQVIDYLDVKKIDIIAHSLGCTMTEGYLRGLKSTKPQVDFDNDNHRFDSVSTVICLAGALHGITESSQAEFRPSGEFMKDWPEFRGERDESVFGEDEVSKQIAPDARWKKVTRLDNDQIRYVAFIANNDFIDAQNNDTGRREGADFIKIFELGPSVKGHEQIVKNQAVFDDFKPFLNQNPPKPPVQITVDKESGSHAPNLEIFVTVNPPTASVRYTAKRLTKKVLDGFIVETVAVTDTGTLSNGGSITLSSDGAWDVVFSADGTEDIIRTYGVNAVIPEVTILTSNEKPFRRNLEVVSSATKGETFFSLDGTHWNKGANVRINETSKIHFIAIDPAGLPSPIVSEHFEEIVFPSATATLPEHFIAKRITVDQFIELIRTLGPTTAVTLFLVDDKWVLDPDAVEPAPIIPAGVEVFPAFIREVGLRIAADKPDGEYPESFDVVISAAHEAGEKVTVYYTTDGSDPSDANNPNRQSFIDSNRFRIEGNGPHTMLCYVKDSAGAETFRCFGWTIDDQEYPETSLSPSMGGVYIGGVDIALTSSEKCEWTKYTTDNSDPSDTNGEMYTGPIPIGKTTTLKFRSKDVAGNLEPVKSATFTIIPQQHQLVFDNSDEKDGYVKANADGGDAFVGSFSKLAIGMGRDGKENRAILHFDTSTLPDNVEIAKAYLEVKDYSKSGDVWADGGMIEVDVQTGCFGSSQAIQSEDWGAPATAEAVARFTEPSTETLRSSEFQEAGIKAINKTGVTQIRLRMNRPDVSSGNCLFLKGGAEARLLVEYSSARS
jgi:pimeloyl-ACP methyl ester carboxylesterase